MHRAKKEREGKEESIIRWAEERMQEDNAQEAKVDRK